MTVTWIKNSNILNMKVSHPTLKKILQWESVVLWVGKGESIWKLDLLAHWGRNTSRRWKHTARTICIIYAFPPQASQAAQEAELNARKAKNSASSLLKLINDLLEQLGQLETVDLNKLNEIEGTLNKAKEEMKVSDLDRKVSSLENEARKQEAAIMDYNRDIEEIMKDIRNLEDIRKTLPTGCFNTPSIEKP